jgi:hypothetical protein
MKVHLVLSTWFWMIDNNTIEGLICLSSLLRKIVYGVGLTTMVMVQQMELKKV